MTSLILNGPEFDQFPSKPENQEKGFRRGLPLIVDGHVDLTYFMMNLPEALPLSALEDGPFTLDKVKGVGVRLFAGALYCQDDFNGEDSLRHLKEVLHFTLEHFDEINIIKGRKDLENLKEDQDMVGTLFLLENADALAGNPSLIDELIEKGVRIVGLTHRGRNRIGDGDAVMVPGGLTREGMDVIRALQDNGLLVDVAHLHPRCFWKLLDVVEGPLVSSHTGIRKICDIQRNMDLEQAQEIIGRGGLVGITFNPEMLSPDGKANIEHVFVHMDVVVQKLGPDGVAIGSDFCGFEEGAEGLEDVTKVPKLMEIMLEHGYGKEAVEKIMGLNWLQIYRRLLR